MNVEFIGSAQTHHLPFVVEAMLAAERVPRGMTMYEAIFGVSSDELRTFLAETLSYDAPGRPLSLGSFRLLAVDNAPVACCASWVEPRDGTASGAWVAMALSRHLGIGRFRARAREIRLLSEMAPRRSPGTLQLESFFVQPEFRGRRLTEQLIGHCLTQDSGGATAAEISLLEENRPAISAYSEAGFLERWRSTAEPDAFNELTGSRGFVQLSLTLDV
jgi:GNAT superfamily N-acetyltransferase